MSPAVQLLQQVWDHCQEATAHSWLKLNHAMHETLSLAVRAGMQFDEDDFSRLFRNARDGGFCAGYWVGSDTEWFYRLAVLYRNASAWQTYEKHCGRKPFIARGASIHTNTGDGPCGGGLSRLIVGAEFAWNGERVRVSSFRDDANPPYFNIVSAATPNQKRGKIMHADLRAASKETRKPVAGEAMEAV